MLLIHPLKAYHLLMKTLNKITFPQPTFAIKFRPKAANPRNSSFEDIFAFISEQMYSGETKLFEA